LIFRLFILRAKMNVRFVAVSVEALRFFERFKCHLLQWMISPGAE
jgi:hypothetical protein